MIGLITAEARATMEKGRRKREREERERMMPASDAHHAAEGALGHVAGEDDEDCTPAAAMPDMGKGYEGVGIHDGPGNPVMPAQISPADFQRPYIGAGHGAPSPGYAPPNVPSVDLRGDRGMARPLSPHAPIPVEGPR